MKRLVLVALVSLGTIRAAQAEVDYVIQMSIDGLAGDILEFALTEYPQSFPNWTRFRNGAAYTYNARTDYYDTYTIPNHTSMITGRPVLQPSGQPNTVHHGVVDDFPVAPQTVHDSGNPNLPYVASTFDVAHDHGWNTAMFASKSKFDFYERSYNAVNGAVDTDPVSGNDGRNKIDRYVYNSDTRELVNLFASEMAAAPYRYSFVHLLSPDSAGHQYGWESPEYLDSLVDVDTRLGTILDLLGSDARLRNKTAIILTADHGGTGFGHGDEADFLVYNVPLFVWAPGIAAGDLYGLFPQSRRDPLDTRPDYNAVPQPLRNGDSGNIAMQLLGLTAVPGSTINPYTSTGGPIADANGPYEFRAGVYSVTASAEGSSGGSLTYLWDKGTTPTAANNVVTLAQSGLTSPASNSTITLTVSTFGGASNSHTVPLTYVNTPPAVNAGDDLTFDATMATAVVRATITDPDLEANSHVAGFEEHSIAWSAGQNKSAAENSVTFADAVAAGMTSGAEATLELAVTDRGEETINDSLVMRYQNTPPQVLSVYGGLDGAGSLLFGAQVSEPDLAVNDLGLGDFEQLTWEFDLAPATSAAEIGDGFLTGVMDLTGDGNVRGGVDPAVLAAIPGFVCCFVDAYVNIADRSGAIHSAAAPAYLTFGDLNFDGRVDGRDMARMVADFGARSGATMAAGDMNGDGRVGLRDLLTLRESWSAAAGSQPVPEPWAIYPTVLATLVVLRAGSLRRGARPR
jgi:hypothetical protein